MKEVLDKFIKVLQVERPFATLTLNFGNHISFVVTLTNLLFVNTNKIKVIAQKRWVKAKIPIDMKILIKTSLCNISAYMIRSATQIIFQFVSVCNSTIMMKFLMCWFVVLQMRKFSNTTRWFTYVCDGSLRVFKHEVPITLADNADDWLLDGLQKSTFTLET